MAPDDDNAALLKLRGALSRHAATQDFLGANFRRLRPGTGSQAWCATLEGTPWFVRLRQADARPLGADPASEWRLLLQAADAGLSPAPRFVAPDGSLLITEFVAAQAWTEHGYQTPTALQRLGAQLGRLHALPPDPAVRHLSFEAQADSLRELAGASIDPALDTRLQIQAGRAWDRLRADTRSSVPCHNDLHAGNLLDDGETLWLVDWEYGGVGDPLYDLASVHTRLASQAELWAAFTDGYGSIDARALPLLPVAAWAYDYVQWLWYRAAEQRLAGSLPYGQRLACRALAERLRLHPCTALQ